VCIFGALNYVVTLHNPETWTSLRYGAWTAFHKDFQFSGFDQFTYIIVTKWRPLFEMYRHPMLAVMIWPLSWVNDQLTDYFRVNCAIYVVAVTYTIVSTLSWWLLFSILRRRVGLSVRMSLLLLLFYFGLAYVMLASCMPDHMIWTQFLLLLTIYLASGRGGLKLWQSLLLYFVATGVTLTNGVKVWLIDMAAMCKSRGTKAEGQCSGFNVQRLFRRSLLYLVPTLILGGVYLLETKTLMADEQSYQKSMRQRKIERDSTAREQFAKDSIFRAKRMEKQSYDNRLFEYTDNSVDRLPLLYENFFGEGFILHPEHLMEDANLKKNPRPVLVYYRDWWNYLAEGAILALFLGGIVCGWRKRLLWLAMMPFLFDVFLHIGMRFAATDVYIMTAHWAFIIPIAMGYLMKHTKHNVAIYRCLVALVCLLTCFLVVWNLGLIVGHMV
jgi:hypothetical protein